MKKIKTNLANIIAKIENIILIYKDDSQLDVYEEISGVAPNISTYSSN